VTERTRRANWAVGLSAFAVAWGLALVAAVFVVPAYNDGSTLAQENSAWIALPVAVPAVLAGIAFLGLHRRCAHGSARGTLSAWVAVAALLAFAVVSILSIGILVLVPAVALLAAASLTPQGAASG
jgi:hypothetical protein